MPRFALLRHDSPQLHWDLLLEHGDTCLTWQLAAEPGYDDEFSLQPAADHRTMYLDYEGPVSGGRGHVTLSDSGRFSWQTMTPEIIVVRLEGAKYSGQLTIHRSGDSSTATLRHLTPDRFVKPALTKLVFRLPGHYDGDLDPSTQSKANARKDET